MRESEQILFIVMSGSAERRMVCAVFGFRSNGTPNVSYVVNDEDCYLSGDHSTKTVTIHIGKWTRGLIFSHLPFGVETK